jgi:hypothetical protein
MKKLQKVTERETRDHLLRCVTMGGVTVRWEYRGNGEYSPKRWYFTMPPGYPKGYISGPYATKWEAVEKAHKCLMGAPTGLPDGAIGTYAFGGGPVTGRFSHTSNLPPR